MNKPILLWQPRATLASDDACTTILKYALPSAPVPPPYKTTGDSTAPCTLSYVPSLAYFCIKKLLEHPDQVHSLGVARILYQLPESPGAYDILRALIPSYRADEELDLSQVDPRLWACIIQIYRALPPAFRTYTLPLSDVHLPLLQRIPSTPDFALLTVLELPGCGGLTDDTVVELRVLHGLCAFDASGTALSAWGISRLSKTLVFAEDEEQLGGILTRPRRGPWGLRMLSLRNCMNVGNKIFNSLTKFPLLSVVDVRGTRCQQRVASPFQPSRDTALFHPASLSASLSHLSQVTSAPDVLFSNSKPFMIHVKGLHYMKSDAQRWQVPDVDKCSEHLPISRRRMDVFLPYEPLRPPSPSYSECGYDYPCSTDEGGSGSENHWSDEEFEEDEDEEVVSWEGEGEDEDDYDVEDTRGQDVISQSLQSVAATTEVTLHADRHSALRFYGAVPRTVSPDSSGPSSVLGQPKRWAGESVKARAKLEPLPYPSVLPVADPYMLFRPPPAWGTLPTSPSQGKANDAHIGAEGRRKRRRIAGAVVDGEMLRVDDARKSARAQQAVKSMIGLVQMWVEAGTAPCAAEKKTDAEGGRSISSNPFSRSAQMRKSGIEENARRTVSELPSAGPSNAAPAMALPKSPKGTREVVQTQTSAKMSRPLRPISTLKVPALPPSCRRAEPASKTKPKDGVRNGKLASSSTQVTLPTLMRASSTRTANSEIQDAVKRTAGGDGKGKAKTLVERGRGGQRGHKQFDWKGWSGQ
ncbi:hypothetical protein AcV7_008864 [Taiwanofungus camphoratus]|nr:hypothetical protein AcV7_008864 [Antrodia cinnamomea]